MKGLNSGWGQSGPRGRGKTGGGGGHCTGVLQRLDKTFLEGSMSSRLWYWADFISSCVSVVIALGILPKVSPPWWEEGLFFRHYLKDVFSVLGKHLMQLPECKVMAHVWVSCVMNFFFPFSFADCFSSNECWRGGGGGLHVYCIAFTLPCHFDFCLFRSSKLHSLHLTLQSPVIWSLDKTGLQTSVIADCPHLLTLSTWTLTKPVLNCSVKNKNSWFIFLSFS